MYMFSQRSLNNLKTVHTDLQKVMESAIIASPYDFGITEGIRTKERQKQLVAEGKSKTMNSRHLTGHAVDIVVYINGKVTWDLQYYKTVADVVKKVAKRKGIAVEWGGDWKTFKDGPHFQLSKTTHP